jgi:hypothetical protein
MSYYGINQYRHGDYKFICDECGFLFHGSEGKLRFDAPNMTVGYFVDDKCWESTHPQLYLKPTRYDEMKPPQNIRPEPADEFVS